MRASRKESGTCDGHDDDVTIVRLRSSRRHRDVSVARARARWVKWARW